MRNIVDKNIGSLERMGYEVEEIPELYEFRIILRSKNKFAFAVYVEYDDMESKDIIIYLVRQFNSMITNKLDIVE